MWLINLPGDARLGVLRIPMLVTRRLSRLSSIAKHRVRSKCNISLTPGEVRPKRKAFTGTMDRVSMYQSIMASSQQRALTSHFLVDARRYR
jgi:hypothetical protein